MMDDDQQFCLRWNNHQSTLISVFDNLLTSQTLVDCTIAAEGKFLKAHKVVLSACSPYFASLLQQQYDKHPILILKDVKYQELTAMMDYMYRGEVNISQDQLAALLKAAESLQIKGLSDNRTGAPKPEHHRGLNIPGSVGGGSKLSSGYTLEQTKRARVGQSGMDSQDLSASREGSSSPSRRRRKVRRRSIENAMTDIHDNSNSSQMQSNQSALLQQPANLVGAGAITAAAAQIPTSSTALSTGTSVGATGATSGQGSTQQSMTASVTKKTESVKGTSDAMKTENVQTSNIVGVDEQEIENIKGDKQNHKQKMTPTVATGKDTSDLVIEPKSEYDDDGNDETVEDLTLDDEEMGMDDLDHNAGTSQGGEGSSQGYAPWQHDRSQDELLLTTQDAQQRDPQDIGGDEQETINLIDDSSAIKKSNVSNAKTQSTLSMGHDASTATANQNESRIRVRNWLMMADQSILEKSIQDTVGSDKLTTTSNARTNVTTNKTLPVSSNNSINSSTINNSTGLPVIDPNTQTMTRIGSIGRTTIACITPAGVGAQGGAHPLKNGIGVSAAALAAAGVELDPIDESMTEVIVKIENSNCSINDEEEEEEHTEDETEDNDYTYDLKLSSPMSWAFDTVKVENEEFEDIMLTEQDNNTEDDDDLLTTAAATTKQAAETSMVETRDSRKRSGTNNVMSNSRSKKRTLNNLQQNQIVQQQQQQHLLEQQQHLQHLQLQPNPHSLQIKLSTIPATITSITPKPSTSTIITTTTNNAHTSTKMADFQSVVSDDKRYRILIQNQRTRKESLEHSEDMIYNADIEKPWVCRNCNRNYKWKNSLKCHLKNECGQPPRYFCSKLCGYATNVHSNLKRHLNTKCRDRIDEDQKSTNNNSNNTYTVVMQKNE